MSKSATAASADRARAVVREVARHHDPQDVNPWIGNFRRQEIDRARALFPGANGAADEVPLALVPGRARGKTGFLLTDRMLYSSFLNFPIPLADIRAVTVEPPTIPFVVQIILGSLICMAMLACAGLPGFLVGLGALRPGELPAWGNTVPILLFMFILHTSGVFKYQGFYYRLLVNGQVVYSGWKLRSFAFWEELLPALGAAARNPKEPPKEEPVVTRSRPAASPPGPVSAEESEAADVLLADDAGGAIAPAPAAGPVGRPATAEDESARRPGRRTSVAALSLPDEPTRKGPARAGRAFALLSLVPGLALLFGPVALLLGLVGLIVGRCQGLARRMRDDLATLGLALLTTAGNWGLVLYAVSVVGLPRPVAWALDIPDPRPRLNQAQTEFKDLRHSALLKSIPMSERRGPFDLGIRAAAFSPDGKRAAVRDMSGVELCDLEKERHWPVSAGEGAGLTFSPGGGWLAAGWSEGKEEVRLYDPLSGRHSRTLPVDGVAIPPQPLLAFSPDGALLAVHNAQTVRVWRTADWQIVQSVRDDDLSVPQTLVFSPDNSTLAVAVAQPFAQATTIVLWDALPGKELARLAAEDVLVKGLAFAPDGKTLASASRTDILLWDVAKRSVTWSVKRDPSDTTLAFSPDGRLLACGWGDGSLVLLDAAGGRRIAATQRGWRHGHLLAARFAADGGTLLTASDRGAIETWDVTALLKQRPRR
jgi:hypothetical protein